jgi:gas vesicle protein
MNDWDENGSRGIPGAGSILLLLGVMLGSAAAFLLATKQGQQVGRQVADRAGAWTAQAADALAQSRESLIAAVEQQQASDTGDTGPVREKPV